MLRTQQSNLLTVKRAVDGMSKNYGCYCVVLPEEE
jgi:hypothetical protein